MSIEAGAQDGAAKPGGRAALFARLAVALKAAGLILGVLALTAIFSLGLGVERYFQQLARALALYGAAVDWCVGWLLELGADLVVRLIGRYVAVGEHWRHVFTFLTLYFMADAFQFWSREDAPRQDPDARPLLPIDNEVRMGLTSFLVGSVILALGAAVVVGLSPLDRSVVSGVTMVGTAAAAVGLYWLVIALAHARWNRWNYAQRPGADPGEPVEAFRPAWRKRAAMGLRRALAGLALGLGVWWVVRTFTPAPAPGLIALGAMAFVLGLFWIWRAWSKARGEGGWRDRWRRARANANLGMGADMALRVAGGAAMVLLNRLLTG